MNKKYWLWLSAMTILAGCSDGGSEDTPDPNTCQPRCGYKFTCIEGTCVEKTKICDPECEPGLECYNNTCVDPKLICEPACGKKEKCIDSTCIPLSRICADDVCTETEFCLNDKCQSLNCSISESKDKNCTTDLKYFCDPENNQWTKCADNKQCSLGECKSLDELECEKDCVDDTTQCVQGSKVPCGENKLCSNNKCIDGCTTPNTCLSDSFVCDDDAVAVKCDEHEKCIKGYCVQTIEEGTPCETEKECTSDGSLLCVENSDASLTWKKCADYESCNNGKCETRIWETCQSDADCKGNYECLKYVMFGKEKISLHDLDPKLPKGRGICSLDCTDDPLVCGANTTCQLFKKGDALWDYQKDVYPIENLTPEKLLRGTPFVSICRPDSTIIDQETNKRSWSASFCTTCKDNNDCHDNYVCKDGQCLPPCDMANKDSQCPYLFTCNSGACLPVTGSCFSCDDADGDGYGAGHCPSPGYDCDETDEEAHYTGTDPLECNSSLDRNCNGKKDDELLGTNQHCSVCDDTCDLTQKCYNVDGNGAFQCIIDPDSEFCTPGICDINNPGRFCEETETANKWKECSKYHICEVQDGHTVCVQDPENVCPPETCLEEFIGCINNTPVDCNPDFEICNKGECVINPKGKYYQDCPPNTCIEGVDDFFCNDSSKPEKCGEGLRCQDGECVTAVNDNAIDIWTICTDDIQCTYGKCVKEIQFAHSDKTVKLNEIDKRIERGQGVCTFDCANNASICNTMTNGDAPAYSCHIITTDENILSNYKKDKSSIDLDKMAMGTPFAAICRPPVNQEAGWSKAFCQTCSSSDDCTKGYMCDDGVCLPPCETDAHCPVFFSCSEDKLCKPIQNGYCLACHDSDNDGSGIGHCDIPGVDCDDNDSSTYFTKEVRNAKTKASCMAADTNCNGINDDAELLGTLYHCTGCGEICSSSPGKDPIDYDLPNHIIDTCVTDKIGTEGTCVSSCAPGYSFKNGKNINDGCIQVAVIQPVRALPITPSTGSIKLYAVDNDGDGYAIDDFLSDILCYSNSGNTACYHLTDVDGDRTWAQLSVSISNDKFDYNNNHYSLVEISAKRDCNDDNELIHPNALEICDGVDNNCDGVTDESNHRDGNPATNVIYPKKGNNTVWGSAKDKAGFDTEDEVLTNRFPNYSETFKNPADYPAHLTDGYPSGYPYNELIKDDGTNYLPDINPITSHDMNQAKAELEWLAQQLPSDAQIYETKKSCDPKKNNCPTDSMGCKNEINYLGYVDCRLGTGSTENEYIYYTLILASSRLAINVPGRFACGRFLNRDTGKYDWQIYSKPIGAVKTLEKQDAAEYYSSIDENGNGVLNDGFLDSCDASCPYKAGWKLISEEKATISQKKEACTLASGNGLAGICGEGHKVPTKNGTTCDACVANEQAIFDFLGDNTDTNCDGFEGDLRRTLFVAVKSTNYGAAVEAPTDTRTPEEIKHFASEEDPIYHLPLLALRPLASLKKAIELGRECMKGDPSVYNGAGCSRICYNSVEGELDTGLFDAYYCENEAAFKACTSKENCHAFKLPWDIMMTSGTFDVTNDDYDLTYDKLPPLFIYRNGFQHFTVTETQGRTRQNILPGNAVWRIFGGANLTQETWSHGTTSSTINIKYTNERFNQKEDIPIFHFDGTENLHFYMNNVNINASANQTVDDDMLFERHSPATLIGMKALNTGRLTLEKSSFKLTAPKGADAPALPNVTTNAHNGHDAASITNIPATTLFTHEAFREWRRKFDSNAYDPETSDLIVCPDGSLISAGGVGAVSPYTTAAYNAALDALENQDAAGYYCPTVDLRKWYIYNFGNRGGNNYLQKTGPDFTFQFDKKSEIAVGAFQCAQTDQNYRLKGQLNWYDDYVTHTGTYCFGNENFTEDGDESLFLNTLIAESGLGGDDEVDGVSPDKYDDAHLNLVIDGDNFNFRSEKTMEDLAGKNGKNGVGGAGAPAFTFSNISENSILHQFFGQQSAYEEASTPVFCNPKMAAYSNAIARSIEASFLAAIKFGSSMVTTLSNDKAAILKGASGGTGGCGGLGGKAGYPGGSAIGFILSPKVDLSVSDDSKIEIISGDGGNGADGQDGMPGGRGGKGFSFPTQVPVSNPFSDSHTFDSITLNPVHGQSGGGGGGGGAGANGKPGYAIGMIFDCSRYKTFEECGLMNNESVRLFKKARITTTLGKTKPKPSETTPAVPGAPVTNATPVESAGGKGGKHSGSAQVMPEIINDKTDDIEVVYNDEKLAYIYTDCQNGPCVLAIGANGQVATE